MFESMILLFCLHTLPGQMPACTTTIREVGVETNVKTLIDQYQQKEEKKLQNQATSFLYSIYDPTTLINSPVVKYGAFVYVLAYKRQVSFGLHPHKLVDDINLFASTNSANVSLTWHF